MINLYYEVKKMTRKHFRELARLMHEHDANPLLIRDVADFCFEQNSRFDRHRFYEASGLTYGE